MLDWAVVGSVVWTTEPAAPGERDRVQRAQLTGNGGPGLAVRRSATRTSSSASQLRVLYRCVARRLAPECRSAGG